MKFAGKTLRVNAALAVIWCFGLLDGGAAFSQTSESPAAQTGDGAGSRPIAASRPTDARSVHRQSSGSHCQQNVRMRHDPMIPQGIGFSPPAAPRKI